MNDEHFDDKQEADGPREIKFTARSILDAYFELLGYEPDPSKWSEDKFADNPPRLVRLRRLVALLKAYDICCAPAKLATGGFLKVDDQHYGRLIEHALEGLSPPFRKSALEDNFPRSYYQTLMAFRLQMQPVIKYSQNYLEGSGWWIVAIFQIQQSEKAIRQEAEKLDNILAAILSPERREFTQTELERDHGFPKDNLGAIDSDWW